MSTDTNSYSPVGRSRSSRGGSAAVVAVGLVIGALYLVLGILRGQTISGVVGLAVMIGYLALMLGLRRRSETAQLLSGKGTDERQAQVVEKATALTGNVLVAVVLAGMMASIATNSRYTEVLGGLACIAGVAFVAGVVWFSHKS